MVQGAPVMTLDLDVPYSTEPSNLARLMSAGEDLGAYYRTQPERQLKSQISHLAAGGYNLLSTRFGPLDRLGFIGNSRI